MLRSALPLKKSVKKAESRETEPWYTTRVDAKHLAENDVSDPGSAPATIRVNTLKAMYGEDAFKQALPYCFDTYIKQEDTQFRQNQEEAGLLGYAITSTMVVLASVRHR